jgi:hypothetical protein
MKNRASKSYPLHACFAILAFAFGFTLTAPLHAQSFQNVPVLSPYPRSLQLLIPIKRRFASA